MGDRHGWSVRAGQIVLVLVVVFAGAWPGSITAQPAAPHDVAPLPGGCGRVTPPGAPEPTCCINGMVIIDGQAVAGAAVTITTDQGDRLTTFTQVYPGPDAQPIYRLSLSAPPLTVEPGQLIHITARYSSHERTIEYMVQPGSQQVDLALARHQADDYAYQRAITSEIAPGAFKRPTAIATDRAGDVYVAGSRPAADHGLQPGWRGSAPVGRLWEWPRPIYRSQRSDRRSVRQRLRHRQRTQPSPEI